MNTSPDGNRKNSYNGDLMKFGKTGERIVFDYLSRFGTVTDLTNDRNKMLADIDFHFSGNNGSWYGEVKTDRYMGKTGNVLYEILRINHTSDLFPLTLGWSFRSEADKLFIYAPSVRKIYYADFSVYRSGFKGVSRTVGSKFKFDVIKTDKIKSTVNVYVPNITNIFSVVDLSDNAG